jgi:protein-S-isoprenylcysteine O-methyltransferase Ste14
VTENNKDHADVKIHPPVLTFIFLVIAYTAKWSISIPYTMPRILNIVGFVFVTLGFVLGFSAFLEFRKAQTTILPHGSVSSIITSSIYRFTRNPIYLGFALMVIGFPLISGTLWGLIIVPVFIYSMNSLVIEREEAYLEKKFGDVYTSYKGRARRWF